MGTGEERTGTAALRDLPFVEKKLEVLGDRRDTKQLNTDRWAAPGRLRVSPKGCGLPQFFSCLYRET